MWLTDARGAVCACMGDTEAWLVIAEALARSTGVAEPTCGARGRGLRYHPDGGTGWASLVRLVWIDPDLRALARQDDWARGCGRRSGVQEFEITLQGACGDGCCYGCGGVVG